MEDPTSPRRVALEFALLSLFVRLIAVQSNIFSSWFSRRSYERSRGEMITMIFEKTLDRKIIATPKDSSSRDHTNKNPQDTRPKPAGTIWDPRILLVKVSRRVGGLFRSNDGPKDAKEPASMGKILNLMRCV